MAKGAHLGKIQFEYTIGILSTQAFQRTIAPATPVNIDGGIVETRAGQGEQGVWALGRDLWLGACGLWLV